MIYMILPAWLIPLLPSLIGGAASIGGSMISRGQAKRDIANQNAYNTPANQLARLREAGLPMAALDGTAHAGSQSALPQSSGGGLSEAGGRLGQYIGTQMQLKQIELLKSQIRVGNSEADKNEAERDWLLSGAGEDRAGTNLTRTLRTRQSMDIASEKGIRLANKILNMEANNKPYRQNLDNWKTIQEIGNLITSQNLGTEHVKGAQLDNAVKKVIAQYQEGMSKNQLERLLKENGLLDENIEGKRLDNAMQTILNRIEENTESGTIMGRGADAMLKSLTWERLHEEFTNYKQYQDFVQLVQDEINREPLDRLKNPGRTLRGIIAWAYTTATGITGQGNLGGSLLQGIR